MSIIKVPLSLNLTLKASLHKLIPVEKFGLEEVYLLFKINFVKWNPKAWSINTFFSSDSTAYDHTDFCSIG